MGVSGADVVRTTADGDRVSISLPRAVGGVRWYGLTRFSGPGLRRDVATAPSGRHRALPAEVLPGARVTTYRRRGFDLHVYEARDRSEARLVWEGPHHQASTRFPGPAPRAEVLDRLVATLDFADDPSGPRLTPRPAVGVEQYGTLLAGWGDDVVLMIRDLRRARDLLPPWQGLLQRNGELWKRPLGLDAGAAAALEGTVHAWRYVLATDSALCEIVFPADGGPTRRGRSADWAWTVLSGVSATWSG
jgi:hypothetical protein